MDEKVSSRRWAAETLAPSGVPGLDEILNGGFPKSAVYLVQGAPGTGKTTLGLQFLLEGARRGECCLYVTVSQTAADLERIAASHGMDLAAIGLHELSPAPLDEHGADPQSILVTSEVELDAILKDLHGLLEAERPARLVLDSLLEVRLLARDLNEYRREVLTIKSRLAQLGTTALFIDSSEAGPGDRQLEAMVHGALSLDRRNPAVGITHRRVQVEKMRAHPFVEGFHDVRITHGGLHAYPRVVPERVPETEVTGQLASGIEGLDDLLGGGLEWGTATILVGQAGAGKSTIATVFARRAAVHDIQSAVFLFEERPAVFRTRSRHLGVGLNGLERSGRLEIQHFGFSSVSPGEFCRSVIDAVDRKGARVVVIDSLTGLLAAMPERAGLLSQLNSLLSYLGRSGVLTVLVVAQHGLMTPTASADVDLSYLADNIILLRQYPSGSQIRRSIAAVKKRHSFHRTDIRELEIDSDGVRIKDTLTSTGELPMLGAEMD